MKPRHPNSPPGPLSWKERGRRKKLPFSSQEKGPGDEFGERNDRVRWWRGSGVVAALVLVFVIVAKVGASEAQRGVRVMAVLDPVVAWIAGSGGRLTEWALVRQTALGTGCSAVAAVIALLGLIVGLRRGVPLMLLATAVPLAVWGQIALLTGRGVAGMYLYGAAVVCAVGLGV